MEAAKLLSERGLFDTLVALFSDSQTAIKALRLSLLRYACCSSIEKYT